MDEDSLFRGQLTEFLKGGFAPNVVLFREFSYDKAGIVLKGLHFSAWTLLGHIRARQLVLSNFIKDPGTNVEIWPRASWSQNYQPKNRYEWDAAIVEYERELADIIVIIGDPATPLLRRHGNGKSVSWAAMAILHHTGYHIGQLKAIGRQLGVW